MKTKIFWVVFVLLYTITAVCLMLGFSSETKAVDEPLSISSEEVEEEEVSEVGVLTKTYYDIPLDYELQDHIFTVSESYGIDPTLVIAVIHKESTFHADSIGDNGNSLGLMQVQPKWHQARMNKYNCHDLLDPYQNIIVGVDYLAEMLGKYNTVEGALMAYNAGPSKANGYISKGIVTDYAKTVLNYKSNLKTIEMGV